MTDPTWKHRRTPSGQLAVILTSERADFARRSTPHTDNAIYRVGAVRADVAEDHTGDGGELGGIGPVPGV